MTFASLTPTLSQREREKGTATSLVETDLQNRADSSFLPLQDTEAGACSLSLAVPFPV